MATRRRREASSPLSGQNNTSGQVAETKDLAVIEEEVLGVSTGHRFATPEERFPYWEQILDHAQRQFMELTTRLGGASEAKQDSQAFSIMINSMISEHPEWNIKQIDSNDLLALLRAYMFGYGPIEDYMLIEGIEEIYFNSFDKGFYIDGEGKKKIGEQLFADKKAMLSFISRIANENGLEINLQKPIMDGKLRDGSRINAVIEPIAVSGATFIIRKHRDIQFKLEDFISSGVITHELAQDLNTWTNTSRNIIVSGGTASGKTTLLNVLGNAFIPKSDRIIILENAKELQIETEDTEYMETRVDPSNLLDPGNINMDTLVRATLRQRPDRIILGEIRDHEAYYALKAWNSGHGGSFCTLHADSARSAISKLEQLVGEAGVIDVSGARLLISDAVDIVLQISRIPGTSQRKITEVIQVFHKTKISGDPHVQTRAADLFDSETIVNYRDDLFYLPLYKMRSDQLTKVNEPLPLENRG